MGIFNEQKLRAEIAKTWGEHGAHIEVYDMLLKKANVVLPQADVIKSVCENGTTRADGYFRNEKAEELCWCCKKPQTVL